MEIKYTVEYSSPTKGGHHHCFDNYDLALSIYDRMVEAGYHTVNIIRQTPKCKALDIWVVSYAKQYQKPVSKNSLQNIK